MISAHAGENSQSGNTGEMRTWISEKAMVKLGAYSKSMTDSLKSSFRLVFKCFLVSVFLMF